MIYLRKTLDFLGGAIFMQLRAVSQAQLLHNIAAIACNRCTKKPAETKTKKKDLLYEQTEKKKKINGKQKKKYKQKILLFC